MAFGRHVMIDHQRDVGARRSTRKPFRFHGLRHTFATLQLAADTNPKIVSEVLGHKEVAITLDRYSHALPTLHTKAMARLDAILGRGADAAPGTSGDKGSNKGSPALAEANEGPDPSVDGAETASLVPHTEWRQRSCGFRLSTVVVQAARLAGRSLPLGPGTLLPQRVVNRAACPTRDVRATFSF
ncbi:MAG: tyrosine-type recombinase/integrase [Chloroflexota bacterium]|nr:tyrosine-type recombinase/integrase [Chloroflexota bacterium]